MPTASTALPTVPPPQTFPPLATVEPCPTGAQPLDCLVSRVEAFAERGEFDGQIIVARSGEIVWEGIYGQDGTGAPMTARTRLGIASVGKMLTAVAAGQLVDADRLAFPETIGSYVDGLPADVAASTLAALLSHTAGLSMYAFREGLVHPVGEFHYSNAGFVLVDLAVEEISGLPIDEYVLRHILEPAGMVDTRFGDQDEGSTARDLLRFVDSLLANELMSAATTRDMTTQKVGTDFGGYAYGFAVMTGEADEAPSFGHLGALPQVIAAVETSPDIDTTLIVLCIEGFAAIHPAIVEYQKAIGMGYWRG